jgi:dihydroorotase
MPRDGASRCDPSEHGRLVAALRRTDIGRLEIGAVGDASVLELAQGNFEYRDVLGETRTGRQRLKAHGLVVAGRWWHPPQA